MGKLFAFEELDENVQGEKLEATPEVGEVADVQVDVEQEVGEIEEQATAIDEGTEAADQLEEVEALVEQAAEEGEGLDPVAAESLRIAVEAICARVGANPKAMYALYATENFQSASSRKANTRFALEGVSEFLKDLWKKIKAALTNLWAKVKAFWDKHLSSLGRIKKALESMKKKVGESSGKLKDRAYIEEAPTGLSDAVGGGDISAKTFNAFVTSHKALLKSAQEVADAAKTFNDAATAGVGSSSVEIGNAINKIKGSAPGKSGTLIGNMTIEYKFVEEGEGVVNLEVERENVDKKDKGGVSLAEKNDVKGAIDGVLGLINDNIKAKDKQDKLQESFNKFSLAIEKAINASTEANKQKGMRDAMKVVYKINAKAPVIQNEVLGLNIKLAKAVLGYASLCVKNYK